MEVRAAMVIQANMFATGACGVRPELVSLLLKRLEDDRIPSVDAGGSVGASDLVPLAQLALGVLGNDFAVSAKEALSLMNSNAISLGRGSIQLYELRRLFAAFDLSSAVALEGLRGNLSSIDEAVSRAHRRQGQACIASRLRSLLAGSSLWDRSAARFLQDPLSFRCISQIHGAGYYALDWAWLVWESELNAVTDNPLIDLDSGRAITHGNMDSTAITMCADILRQILTKIAILSGERMHKLHWQTFSGLPTGLTFDRDHALGGVQFLNFSHIAASLIASLKIWSHPHLTHSIGQLSDGVEDTAGLALHSVTDLKKSVEGGWKIAALEIMIGLWAVKRRGISADQLGAGIRPLYEAIVPMLPIGSEGMDSPFDVRAVVDLIKTGGLLEEAFRAAMLPPPHSHQKNVYN
jgi:histidine ammonia-lyase